MPSDSPSNFEILTFELSGQRCALRAEHVLEVQRAVAMAPLPGAVPLVEGVINLRGKLVPVLDIRARLGLEPSRLSVRDHLLVAGIPGDGAGLRVVAIRVDRALELVSVPREQIEDPPGMAGPVQTAAIAKLPDGLVLIHDLSAFLSLDEAAQLDQALTGLGR